MILLILYLTYTTFFSLAIPGPARLRVAAMAEQGR